MFLLASVLVETTAGKFSVPLSFHKMTSEHYNPIEPPDETSNPMTDVEDRKKSLHELPRKYNQYSIHYELEYDALRELSVLESNNLSQT